MLFSELKTQFPKPGRLVEIGLRPARKLALVNVAEAMADEKYGLIGDRYQGQSGKRQVTLIQQEHLAVIEAITNVPVTSAMLRRNLVIAGINLLALNKQQFRIGEAVFLATGLCHPCSRMEQILGPGGYNAMRGHGGLTAKIISSGLIRVDDEVKPITEN
jgi:MOSC domain-containing protein YiiM